MNRYRAYGRLDEVSEPNGDVRLIGVDEREPAQVPPGFVSEAINYTFRDGRARPRRGCIPLPWMNDQCAPKWPWCFTAPHGVCFEWPISILGEGGKALAAGVFSDPDGKEWIILAGNPPGTGPTQVWYLRQGVKARLMPVPADMPRLETCSFTQCFNRLIMFRGKQYPELELDNVREGFRSIVQQENEESGEGTYNPEDGTEEIPNADAGLFLQNRLFIPHARDLVAASDFLNYTRYAGTRADFRINQGSADKLVAIYKLGEQSIVAFKESSIYLVNNVRGDLSELQLQEVTREFGLVGRQAVVGDGSAVFFVSQQGITTIGQVLDNKVRTRASEPTQRLSDAIPLTWRRLNWRYASGIKAAFYDGKVYFAVPLDDATMTTGGVTYTGVNNAVLVYDTSQQAWAGIHVAECLMVKDWFLFRDLGKTLLGFVSEDGRLYVYGLTFNDRVRPAPGSTEGQLREIKTRIVSRAYRTHSGRVREQEWRPGGTSRFNQIEVQLGTWDAMHTMEAKVDGIAEKLTFFSQKTVDRQEEKRFDAARWNVENDDGGHGRPGRLDYSADLTRGSEIRVKECGPILLGQGVNFEAVQDAPERGRINKHGAHVQVILANERGRAEVAGFAVMGRAGTRKGGRLV